MRTILRILREHTGSGGQLISSQILGGSERAQMNKIVRCAQHHDRTDHTDVKYM